MIKATWRPHTREPGFAEFGINRRDTSATKGDLTLELNEFCNVRAELIDGCITIRTNVDPAVVEIVLLYTIVLYEHLHLQRDYDADAGELRQFTFR